jgi:hypothetical protein
MSQDRSIVQGGKQERVKAVFYTKDAEKQNGEAARADRRGLQELIDGRSGRAGPREVVQEPQGRRLVSLDIQRG